MHIEPIPDQPPKEAPGSSRCLVVKETNVVHITRDQLQFVDEESPDSELTYAVTSPPFYRGPHGSVWSTPEDTTTRRPSRQDRYPYLLSQTAAALTPDGCSWWIASPSSPKTPRHRRCSCSHRYSAVTADRRCGRSYRLACGRNVQVFPAGPQMHHLVWLPTAPVLKKTSDSGCVSIKRPTFLFEPCSVSPYSVVPPARSKLPEGGLHASDGGHWSRPSARWAGSVRHQPPGQNSDRDLLQHHRDAGGQPATAGAAIIISLLEVGESDSDRPQACVLFQVVASALMVDEGGASPLSSQNLLLSDLDSREEALQVQLREGPRHGALSVGPVPLERGRSFTVKDLKSLQIRSGASSPADFPGPCAWRWLLRFYCCLPPGTATMALKPWRTAWSSRPRTAPTWSPLSWK